MTAEESGDKSALSDASDGEHEPQFAPIVTLPEVDVPTHEEDEVEILKLRAKLYRFDRSGTVPEWKERGTGEVKMLKHDGNKTVRVVMRRDKTLKVCANHFITPLMELKPKLGMDKAFVYTSPADFTYEAVLSETFAIKFGSIEYATQFKTKFLDSQKYVKEECKLYNGQAEEEDDDEDALEYEDSDENDENEAPAVESNVTKETEKNVVDVAEKLNNMAVKEQDIANAAE